MKKTTIYSKKIIRSINKSIKNHDFDLNLDHLINEKYFNIEIDEWYGDTFKVKGKLKQLVIKTLLKTYFEWEKTLKKLDKKYYLAIWLYNPRMLKSEVVCSIDEKISYYENDCFISSKNSAVLNTNEYQLLSLMGNKFIWRKEIDFEFIYDWEINWPREQYSSDKDYYKSYKVYKKIIQNSELIVSNNETYYMHQKGNIWVGQQNHILPEYG